MGQDYRPGAPVTRAEFVKFIDAVQGMAGELKKVMHVQEMLLRRWEQLDRHVMELSKAVDELNPNRIDA